MNYRLDGRRPASTRTPRVRAGGCLSRRRALRVVLFAMAGTCLAPAEARADDAAAKSRRGAAMAKSGNCVGAVPLLEEAELSAHRPSAALALGDCYVALGELLRAAETYRALADEKPGRTHTYADRIAIQQARGRLTKVEQRIPTLAFQLSEPYEDLEVFVNGELMADPTQPRKVEPHVALRIVARAKGRAEQQESVELEEGERLVRPLRLDPQAGAAQPAQEPDKRKKRARKPGEDRDWLGLRFRGYLIPKAVMGLFGDGGRTVLVPGGSLVYTVATSDPQIHITLGYANYQLGPTPFKPKGSPDTDYEIIESTLEAAYGTVEVTWMEPLDERADWQFHYGFGLGVGWMLRGELYRTQAYPSGLVPGDPYSYRKCGGPNDPAGSFRYCNSLDFDAKHYNYAEPGWTQGGNRPQIYPWLAFPLLGLSVRADKDFMLDFEASVTDSGFMLGAGARAGL